MTASLVTSMTASLVTILSSSMILLLAACGGEVAGGKVDGAAIYAEACARCHGRDGVPPPDMAAQLRVRDLTASELDAAALGSRIARGVPGTAMPAFAGALDDAQLGAVTAYVLELRQRRDSPAGHAPGQPATAR